jgi:hypothetical protein
MREEDKEWAAISAWLRANGLVLLIPWKGKPHLARKAPRS